VLDAREIGDCWSAEPNNSGDVDEENICSSMDPLCLGVAFIIWMAFFVCVMLFGDNPFFENTPIAYANWVFNDGIFIFVW
jgi:hypothetical protein